MLCSCSSNNENKNEQTSNFDIVYDLQNKTNILNNSDTIFECERDYNKVKYFFFKIGTIENVPFYSSMSFMYDDFDYDVVLSFNKLTENTISTTIENSTQLVTGYEDYLTWYVEGGISLGINEIFGINFSLGISEQEHSYFEQKVINSYKRTESYLEQYSEGFSVKVPINVQNGFQKKRKYKVCFYETFNVYGVVSYNKTKTNDEQFQYSTVSLVGDNEISMYIEQSDANGLFEYGHSGHLNFNKDYAKKYAERIINNDKPLGYRNKGTKDNPYEIRDEVDFLDFTSPSFNKPGKYAKLVSDLDFQYYTTDPFGTLDASLDGNNHTIRNKLINKGTLQKLNGISSLCYGLFQSISATGNVCNLFLENIIVTDDLNDEKLNCDSVNIGLVCGINCGTIKKCRSSGTKNNGYISITSLTSRSVDYNFGSICGRNLNCIENCEFNKISIRLFLDNRSCVSTFKQVGANIGGLVGTHEEGDISLCSISQIFIDIDVKTRKEDFSNNPGIFIGRIFPKFAYGSSNKADNLMSGSSFRFSLYSDSVTCISTQIIPFNQSGILA